MKYLQLVAVLTVLFCSFLRAEESCTAEVSDNGQQYHVMNSAGQNLGYISPNADGSWFMWIDRQGAMNQSADNLYSALETVCQSSAQAKSE
ncbi:hypothetical protein EOPP23_07755 [Endozoicomonas sp. OPT23]|uniref:hypothetical protein n=1 Tax=Endozoicomonas sp. OPT23 TaxID=2072845 RepID=UPI00129A2852|nr:hypothetical protein [Endozoicomonas sp. OPT23]MRI32877.1 hypothetical protein [Endozoicomonas sp. OPT23]